MNILLKFGLLIVIAYIIGLLLEKARMPKTIGYILTGVAFSPDSMGFITDNFIQAMELILKVSLAFIAFEVGGELKWSKIRSHKKEIFSITFLASIFPFILISFGLYVYILLFPATFTFNQSNLLLLVLILGALSAPTAPASVFAVIHQYKSKGKVTETILEVVALDDVLGILLFSLTINVLPYFIEAPVGLNESVSLTDALFKIVAALITGVILGYLFNPISRFLKIKSDDQWIVVIFSLILVGTGISVLLEADVLLIAMTIGLMVTNTCNQQKKIFNILKRYTENLIFLIFFLLSGLHLDISAFPKAAPFILLFVLLRIFGKFLGVNIGGRLANSDSKVRKFTFGGLIPQAGVAIGLALSIYNNKGYKEISNIMLSVIMGATIINGVAGPIMARYTLKKSGEVYAGEDHFSPKEEHEFNQRTHKK